ncbi:hypothetical protein ACWCXC_15695 [Streptomyces sp. NPDC001515]
MDLTPAANTRLVVRVPTPLGAGGWTWGPLVELPGDLGQEWAYSDTEVRALVHVYGRMVSQIVTRSQVGADRFRVDAWGMVTGLCVGMREWAWSVSARAFEPVGEYLSGWRDAARAYYLKTGRMIDRERFTASIGIPAVPAMGALPSSALAA